MPEHISNNRCTKYLKHGIQAKTYPHGDMGIYDLTTLTNYPFLIYQCHCYTWYHWLLHWPEIGYTNCDLQCIWPQTSNGRWNPIKSRSRYRDNLVQFQVLRNYRKQHDTGMLCIIIHADILRLNRTRDYIRDHCILYFQLVDQYRSAIN